jgi:hypothetical protein
MTTPWNQLGFILVRFAAPVHTTAPPAIAVAMQLCTISIHKSKTCSCEDVDWDDVPCLGRSDENTKPLSLIVLEGSFEYIPTRKEARSPALLLSPLPAALIYIPAHVSVQAN